MERMLVVDATGLVVNVVVIGSGSAWTAPHGASVEPAPDGIGIGWRRTGAGWQKETPAPE